MSQELKAKRHWEPTASLPLLKKRAQLIKKIRQFFEQRAVLEVDTPLLSEGGTTDPHIASFLTQGAFPHAAPLYLQTSPEFAMKRLLAAGSGPIYQVCKAFRAEEAGKHHHPEFTLLEWYQPGFTLHQLIDEVDELLTSILKTPAGQRLTYADVFETHLNVNPHTATLEELNHVAHQHGLRCSDSLVPSRDDWLDLLLTHCILPQFDTSRPTFLYHYPASQAALARIDHTHTPPVAERFEVFFGTLELANGYHELTDATEQQYRFEQDNLSRKQMGHPEIHMDKKLIAALQHGLPPCSGVALGVDRLVMLATGEKNLSAVISFVE